MAFESWLSTDSLLGTMVVLLGTLNFSISRLKGIFTKVEKGLTIMNEYLKSDMRIRARLEQKADWLMNRQGIDIEKFNIDAEGNLLDEFEKFDL